jgi:excisionase family DNA binding protein
MIDRDQDDSRTEQAATPQAEVRPLWLTTEEAAARLDYHPKYVALLCRTGKLAAFQPYPRAHYRIKPEDLQRFLSGESPLRRRGPKTHRARPRTAIKPAA